MRWDDVLTEVLDKEAYQTALKNIRNSHQDLNRVVKNKPCKNKPRAQRSYALGDQFPGVMFTQREAECMLCFLLGKTIAATAESLNLSPRTIEYYVKNMRNKLHCKSKSELIGVVLQSGFIANLDQEPAVV